MKFVRFGPAGQEKPGAVDPQGQMRDISSLVPDIAGATLDPDALAAITVERIADLPLVPEGTRLGACVGSVGYFIAIGLNYADHAEESGMAVPPEPIVFTKAPSCVVGPNDEVRIPPGSVKTDWEVELAVVIGREASYITEDQVDGVLAGYCVCNDVSERDYQMNRGGSQWTKGKGCPTFGPLGPWLVTPDEIADVQKLSMWLDVNGKPMQRGSTSTMIFNVRQIVAHLSQFMTLRHGDVITTGTPPGVGFGMRPEVYLKPGDVMALGIEGLGEQRQQVVATTL